MVPCPPGGTRGGVRRRVAAARLAVVAAVLLCLVAPPFAAGGAARVMVELPVPAKLNTRGIRTILVARFIAPDHPGLDVGKEFVRWTRRELAKGTRFRILEVEAPNLPEQPPEELVKNYVFWKHIAEEYGADLVVSGRVVLTTQDRSAFVQEDFISPMTGQKVRSTRFAEREEFALEVNLWFFKGANGAFLYEDTFRNREVYEGKSNDALGIFYQLTEMMIPDLLGVVTTQKKQEPRYLFEE